MLRCASVRTTIDIPEQLLRHAKAEAALRGLRLKDLVREALQGHLRQVGRTSEPAAASRLDSQELGPGRVFPLVTGPTGSVLRQLRGPGARRLLDEEDVDRQVDTP
jgi:hypothetical protein